MAHTLEVWEAVVACRVRAQTRRHAGAVRERRRAALLDTAAFKAAAFIQEARPVLPAGLVGDAPGSDCAEAPGRVAELAGATARCRLLRERVGSAA